MARSDVMSAGCPNRCTGMMARVLPGTIGFLHADGIEQQRSRVDVNKGDAEPTIERRGCAGNKREIRYNDLAAVIEAVMIKYRSQRNTQGVGAMG